MGRITDPNRKPIANREVSGAKKDRKRKKVKEETIKASIHAAKFFKKTKISTTESGKSMSFKNLLIAIICLKKQFIYNNFISQIH